MSTSHLEKRLLEADEAFKRHADSTSAIDWKVDVKRLIDIIADAVSTVRPLSPSECSNLGTVGAEADYLKKEQRTLEDLQAAVGSLHHEVCLRSEASNYTLTEKHFTLLEGRDKWPRVWSVGRAEQEVTGHDDLKRKLRYFHHALQNVLVSGGLRKSTDDTAEGASGGTMEGLKKEVEKVATAVQLDVLEAHYREQVASVQSRHQALMTVVDKFEAQHSRLRLLEAVQREHHDTIEKMQGIVTDSYEALNSAKEKYSLMLSHLKKAGGEQTSNRRPLLARDWRWADPGADVDAQLKHFQNVLLDFAAAVDREDAHEASCLESLSEAFRGIKNERKQDEVQVLPFLREVKVLKESAQNRTEKFRRAAFVDFHLRPQDFEKKAARYCFK